MVVLGRGSREDVVIIRVPEKGGVHSVLLEHFVETEGAERRDADVLAACDYEERREWKEEGGGRRGEGEGRREVLVNGFLSSYHYLPVIRYQSELSCI